MFEGVRVFSKSDAEHIAGKGKDVRNLIGGIYGVRFVEGKAPDTGSLVGTFKALDPTDAAVTKMTEAVKRGMQSLLGPSIDADARTKQRKAGGETLRGKFILSLNDTPGVREVFANFRIEAVKTRYSISSTDKKEAAEVPITNFKPS